jgi:hypothetical protein
MPVADTGAQARQGDRAAGRTVAIRARPERPGRLPRPAGRQDRSGGPAPGPGRRRADVRGDLDACARALLRAGAGSVDVLVFARVVDAVRAPYRYGCRIGRRTVERSCPPVEIYTTPYCPYCRRAKELLREKKGVDFKEIDVSRDRELRRAMTARAAAAPPCRRFSSAIPMSAAATTSTRSTTPASSTRCFNRRTSQPA